jgi:hypothetical protein
MKKQISERDVEKFKHLFKAVKSDQSRYAKLFANAKKYPRPDLEALLKASKTGKLEVEDKEKKAVLEGIKRVIEISDEAKEFKASVQELDKPLTAIYRNRQPNSTASVTDLLGASILLFAVLLKYTTKAWEDWDK